MSEIAMLQQQSASLSSRAKKPRPRMSLRRGLKEIPTPFLGIVSPPGCMFSVRCTRGSNSPVERTGGEARCQVYQSLDSETPFGPGESTRTTRNGVNFRNASDTRCRRQFTRSGNCRIDAVSGGRDEASRPCCAAVREVHRKLIGECELTDMGGNSRSTPI